MRFGAGSLYLDIDQEEVLPSPLATPIDMLIQGAYATLCSDICPFI